MQDGIWLALEGKEREKGRKEDVLTELMFSYLFFTAL